ncbi:hypothetical protein B0A50_07420 [Salinomyces thailandicus]|uniref:Uncharacterized protein n=1 Tax=Salinomyces thailandicus TaxID=706561 RepID=A0A4U0TP35_9PEZI|nr:hypothetical protein B0A50_07420 [Salinomyces thailandica]
MFHAPPHPFYYIAPGPTCAYLNGPMGINGLFTPPPSYQILASTPTPIQKPAPPAPKAPKKKIALPPLPPPPPPPPPEPQKKSEIAIKKTSNFYAPPSIPPGTNYWFPAERTQLHIFNKGVKIWEERWKGDKKAFKSFSVDVNWPAKAIIERTRGATTAEQGAVLAAGWAVTEVIERGDNTFLKFVLGIEEGEGVAAGMAGGA